MSDKGTPDEVERLKKQVEELKYKAELWRNRARMYKTGLDGVEFWVNTTPEELERLRGESGCILDILNEPEQESKGQ